jgi:2-haloacid dehalogenase
VPPFPIDAVVFDVLGTLVDETAGIRSAIAEVAPSRDGAAVDDLSRRWLQLLDEEQQRILDGRRAYAPSHVLDAEAATVVAAELGLTDPDVVARLTAAGRLVPPWADTHAGLARLAEHLPVVALSNASSATLLRIAAHAGLRWHLALSAQAAATYKPDPAAYRLAVDATGFPPERLLMVAAHGWDLRGARAVGLRTAYVARPAGDPPEPGDRVDLRADDLDDLVDQLTTP